MQAPVAPLFLEQFIVDTHRARSAGSAADSGVRAYAAMVG